ncbi:MAG: Hsp33 family molecular chaperone HslO [Alphaproteobacteria bacterium]
MVQASPSGDNTETDHIDFRGRLVRLGPVIQEILSRHNYPIPVAQILAELLALAVAMSSALKYEGSFSLQIRGDGPVSLMLADVTHTGEVRGYADVRASRVNEIDDASDFAKIFGKGYLAFTVDQGSHAQLYQGIVELKGNDLTSGITHYFRQSEQFDAALKIAARRTNEGTWRAAAAMLQRLPEQKSDNPSEDELASRAAWQNAMVLMATLSDRELLDFDLTASDLLFRLFHEDGVRVFEPRPIHVGCRCSQEKVEKVVASLTSEQRQEMTVDGEITVTCQFCNKIFRFSEEAIAALGT